MNHPGLEVHGRRAIALASLLVAALTCAAPVTRAVAQCVISGPDNVDEGARFTLCAPTGYTYRWTGPGVPGGVTSRCITLSGRPTGLYEYTVTLYSGGVYRNQCTQVVTVGEAPDPGQPEGNPCTISGPTVIPAGQTAQLCGRPSTFEMHSYSWTGPGGFQSSSRCISVSRPGTYTLTTRSQVTGRVRSCSQRLDVEGAGGGGAEICEITGPDTFEPGTRVRLCGPSGVSNYRWTGPGNFFASTSCVNVGREGTYTLSYRDQFGTLRQCTHYLDTWLGPDDSEQPFAENCPRNHAFWSAVARGSRTDVSAAELRSIARRVDELSRAFSWGNDATGFSQTLRPAGTLTQRKQAARQLAAIYANIAAAELGITDRNGQAIGLEAETSLSFRNARTIGELAALVDRMLVRGRGNFTTANRTMQSVNNGRGIGPVCGE